MTSTMTGRPTTPKRAIPSARNAAAISSLKNTTGIALRARTTTNEKHELRVDAGVSEEAGASRSHVTLVEVADRIDYLVRTIPNMDGVKHNDKLRRGLVDLAKELRHHATEPPAEAGALKENSNGDEETAHEAPHAASQNDQGSAAPLVPGLPEVDRARRVVGEAGAVPPPSTPTCRNCGLPVSAHAFGCQIADVHWTAVRLPETAK